MLGLAVALLGMAAPTTAQAKTITLNLGHPLAMVSNQIWFVNWTNEEAFAVAKALYWVDPVKSELEKQNMKLIYVQVLPKYQIWSWRKLKTLADLKGKKIRSWGPYMPRLYTAIGAVGVNLVAAR